MKSGVSHHLYVLSSRAKLICCISVSSSQDWINFTRKFQSVALALRTTATRQM